jgi:hypothetical protein
MYPIEDKKEYSTNYALASKPEKQGTCYTTQTWPKTKTIKTKLESIHPLTHDNTTKAKPNKYKTYAKLKD